MAHSFERPSGAPANPLVDSKSHELEYITSLTVSAQEVPFVICGFVLRLASCQPSIYISYEYSSVSHI